MILVSSEMFETITTRAYEVAREAIRRMEFDSGPKFTEAMNLIRGILFLSSSTGWIRRLTKSAMPILWWPRMISGRLGKSPDEPNQTF
jgi:hypothetical protein